jgi:hypothetical protein
MMAFPFFKRQEKNTKRRARKAQINHIFTGGRCCLFSSGATVDLSAWTATPTHL